MIKNFEDMKQQLSNLTDKKKIAVVSAHDENSIKAVLEAAADNLVEPILIGKEDDIKRIILEMNFSNNIQYSIIDVQNNEKAVLKAVQLVKEKKADFIMKGKIATGELMKVVVDREKGIRDQDTMSLLALIDSPYYHKVLGITDVGLLIKPTLEQKKDALENAVLAFKKLGIETPKAAVLTAVEKVNEKMPETLDALDIKESYKDDKSCIVEGPISYDLSVSKKAAEIKGYSSQVAGDADILIVPEITAGNLLAKSLVYTGGADTCGIVLGAQVPLVLTSRSAKAKDKLMSIIFAALVS